MRVTDVRLYIVWLVVMIQCSGCFWVYRIEDVVIPQNLTIDRTSKLRLNTKNPMVYLYHADILRLLHFMSTAEPNASIRWRTYLMTYTLSSHAIFLDKEGWPCRTYQLQVKSILPFRKSMTFSDTACRAVDGQWKSIH